MFDLSGKTALVTGATQGIGFEIARLLAENGARVFVAGSSSMEKCVKASQKIKNSTPVLANLLDPDCDEVLFEQTGEVDILVLNASIQYKREWNSFTDEEYDIQMTCNLKSSYLLIKKYAEKMKKRGWGRIVTVGIVNQYNQHPELSLYGVTKAAQLKLVQNLAPLLAPYGITINNVAPGVVATPRNDEVLSDPDFKKRIEEKIPCGFIAEPEDISPAVLLLCSEEGRYITGSDLVIDGGMHLK